MKTLSLTLTLSLYASLYGLPPAAAGPLKKAPPRKTAAGVPAEIKRLLRDAPPASRYPNAAKATLRDEAEIVVRPDGSSRSITRQTIKVFNERGRDNESEVRIPYNSAFERVTITRARTIKPDGRIFPVKPSDIRDQGHDEGENAYSDARIKSFSLPAVDDGAILDYEYVTEKRRSQLPGHYWESWVFQGGNDPVVVSRIAVTVPRSRTLHRNLRNIDLKPTATPSADGRNVTYVWAARNVPPIEMEPMMPGPKRVAPLLTLSTVGSWQEIAAWYWKLARNRMTADPAIKARVAALTKGKATPEEKAKAIFYWVEEKTRYVALEFGISAYQPRPAADVCRNQYGDCKDMTTLLVAMLKEAGITAHPVLLRAGSTESVRDDLPSPGAFNHAICLAEIGGRKFWLDATAQLAPWGEIPGPDRGAEAFVIRNGIGAFETIPYASPEENRMEKEVRLALASDGSATGTVRITGRGDSDMGLRGALTYLRPDRVKEFVERMAQSLSPNARVTKYGVSDFRNKDLPVTIDFEVALPAWASKTGNLLLFKARPEQRTASGSSPFLQETRQYPIRQDDAGQVVSVLEVVLPAGFSPLSVPEAASIESELGLFQRTVEHTNNTLRITLRGESRRAEVPASRYTDVRKYFDDLLKAADETVVLKQG